MNMLNLKMITGAGAMLLCTMTMPAYAVPITTLFNTGVDSTGTPLPDGTVGDSHYTLITVPGGTSTILSRRAVGGFPIPPYIGDSALSSWIGPNNSISLDGPGGPYTYRTTFDLTGLAPGTASITGGWTTDNNGLDILINGVSLGFTTPFAAFAAGFFPFTVTSSFISGINTLDFVVFNGGGPTALRVEMTGDASRVSVSVPEPETLALLGLGLLGMGISAKRKILLRHCRHAE